MSFLSKIRKNKLLKNALKKANDPIWFVEYETQDDKGQVNVFASNYKEAINRASDILLYKCDSSFKITGAACI